MTVKSKRLISSLIISLVIFGGIKLVYSKYEKSKYTTLYVVKQEIYEGEKIAREYISTLKVENVNNPGINIGKIFNGESLNKMFAKYDLKKGQIITDEYVSKNIPEESEEKEFISINIDAGDEAMSYQIESKDIVNVYYTSQIGMVDSLLESKEKVYSSESKNGNATYKLLNNIEVIGIFDESGKEISNTENLTKVFKTVVFRVDKKTAMLISNIKGLGTFNLTKTK